MTSLDNSGDIPEMVVSVPPAAAEPFDAEPGPARGEAVAWHELTDAQKLDVLNHKVEQLLTKVDWIGTNFSGILDMASKLNMGVVGKMMGLGGKNNV